MSLKKLFTISLVCLLFTNDTSAVGENIKDVSEAREKVGETLREGISQIAIIGQIINETEKTIVFDKATNVIGITLPGRHKLKAGKRRDFSVREIPFEVEFTYENKRYILKVNNVNQRFKLTIKPNFPGMKYVRALRIETVEAEASLSKTV